MSERDKQGSKVALPSAPLGPLSSVETHSTWGEREGGEVGGEGRGRGVGGGGKWVRRKEEDK